MPRHQGQAGSAPEVWRRLREAFAARGSHTAAAVAADMVQALHALREGHDAAAGPAVARALTAWRSAVDLG